MTTEKERVILRPQSDKVLSLWNLIMEYEQNMLIPPPHQRAYVWNTAKEQAWIETLIKSTLPNTDTRPIGVMVTYQLRDSSVSYLNDGFQRLTATRHFLQHYKRYTLGNRPMTKEQAVSIVQAYEVLVQHRRYNDQREALYWFQVLQLGTALTPAEFSRGFLEYLQPDVNWRPFLDQLHTYLSNLVDKNSKNYKFVKVSGYLAQRYSYALFYMWLSQRRQLSPDFISITHKHLNLADAQNGKMVEQRLGDYLKRLGVNNVLDEFKLFKMYIDEQARVIREVWEDYYKSQGARVTASKEGLFLTSTLFRFLLNVSVWRRNQGLNDTYDDFTSFLRLVYLYSDGKASIGRPLDEHRVERVVITIGSAAKLSQVVSVVDFEPYRQQIKLSTQAVRESEKKIETSERGHVLSKHLELKRELRHAS